MFRKYKWLLRHLSYQICSDAFFYVYQKEFVVKCKMPYERKHVCGREKCNKPPFLCDKLSNWKAQKTSLSFTKEVNPTKYLSHNHLLAMSNKLSLIFSSKGNFPYDYCCFLPMLFEKWSPEGLYRQHELIKFIMSLPLVGKILNKLMGILQ